MSETGEVAAQKNTILITKVYQLDVRNQRAKTKGVRIVKCNEHNMAERLAASSGLYEEMKTENAEAINSCQEQQQLPTQSHRELCTSLLAHWTKTQCLLCGRVPDQGCEGGIRNRMWQMVGRQQCQKVLNLDNLLVGAQSEGSFWTDRRKWIFRAFSDPLQFADKRMPQPLVDKLKALLRYPPCCGICSECMSATTFVTASIIAGFLGTISALFTSTTFYTTTVLEGASSSHAMALKVLRAIWMCSDGSPLPNLQFWVPGGWKLRDKRDNMKDLATIAGQKEALSKGMPILAQVSVMNVGIVVVVVLIVVIMLLLLSLSKMFKYTLILNLQAGDTVNFTHHRLKTIGKRAADGRAIELKGSRLYTKESLVVELTKVEGGKSGTLGSKDGTEESLEKLKDIIKEKGTEKVVQLTGAEWWSTGLPDKLVRPDAFVQIDDQIFYKFSPNVFEPMISHDSTKNEDEDWVAARYTDIKKSENGDVFVFPHTSRMHQSIFQSLYELNLNDLLAVNVVDGDGDQDYTPAAASPAS